MSASPVQPRVTAFALCALAGVASAYGATRVAVRAQADPSYVESPSRSDPSKAESYVFYPGKFFPGHIPDRTLERTPFRAVAEFLAPHLAQQRYVPARSLETADLIIVVHWGATMGFDRSAALFNYTLDNQRQTAALRESMSEYLPSAAGSGQNPENMNLVASARLQVNYATTDIGASESGALLQLGRDLSLTSNAGLLGIQDLLHEASQSAVVTASAGTLDAMLDEDRYFVIVMAYDRKALLEQRVLQRRWSTRLSIRAAGRNFLGALAQLGPAGGDVFGSQVAGVYIARPRLREARVEVGEIVVADVEGNSAKRP